MGLFSKDKGITDIIRCDEPSYLIWKWRPRGSQLSTSSRENAIRWGSSLRVKEGEVAVFVYRRKDGTSQDFIEGPFDETLKTANLPILSNILGLAYGGGSPFQAEVYFINLATIIQVPFGVPYFDVYDPRFLDFGVPVAVRGTISFRIDDYRRFIKINRLVSFRLEDFNKQIRDAVSRYAKDAVANAPAANDIPVVQIETKTALINDIVELNIKDRLIENFGVSVSGVDIKAIEIDKGSDGYRQLMSVTQDLAAMTARAQAEARVKDIHDKQRIEAENYQESLRIQREEGQYAQHKQTQTENFAAYQVEKQAEVGVAGAEALGHMGSNGAGDVDLSGGGVGFNPAAMMAGMAIGGAVGQNMAGVMNNMMSGINQSAETPPPVPSEKYYVASDGQATGPFDLNALKQMAASGIFKRESYVWKSGMEEWVPAENVGALAELFGEMPPVPKS